MQRGLHKLCIQAPSRTFVTSGIRRSHSLPKTIRQVLESASNNVHSEGQVADIAVQGWVKSVRRQKHIAFAQLSDGTDLNSKGLQVVFEDPMLADQLTLGSSVRLLGSMVKSPAKGQDFEFAARNVTVLGFCDPEHYPIQKKTHTTEFLREHAHLRSRTDEIAKMLRLRHATKRAFEDYYDANNFVNIQTPILTMNDCEGGGEVFRVTPDQSFLDEPTDKTSSDDNTSIDFFGAPTFLTVSSQLHLEVFSSAFSRVYTLQPAFRAERSHTNRHLSEFWMLEAEMAFMNGLGGVMDVVEASIKHVLSNEAFRTTLSSAQRIVYLDSLLTAPWKRITYTRAVERIRNALGTDGIQWGSSISIELERWIADEVGNGLPIFVTDYPSNLKPFYMRPSSEGANTVACFDLLVPRIGELAGGSLREERFDRIEESLRKHHMDPSQYAWYTELRRFGTTPHGGFGLGFERFISWIGEWENIRECIPAPRWKGRCIL